MAKPPVVPESSAVNFLSLLDPDTDAHLFACFDYKRKLPAKDHVCGSYPEVKPNLNALNKKGYCVYVAVNRMAAKKRGKEHCVEIRDVWVDDDIPKKKPRTDFPLEPSCVVETSKGKYQYHWFTRTKDFNTFERVMQTMVTEYGCDKNALGLARVLRLPGYYHNKDIEHPFQSRIVGGNKNIYGWDEIIKNFPPAEKVVKSNRDERGKFDKNAAIESLIKGDNYHDSLCSLALRYANKKLDRDEILFVLGGIMDAIPETDRRPEWEHRRGVQHLGECVDSALKKVNREKKAKASGNKPETISVEDLLGADFPPMEWIVDSLLPAGSTLFFGKPKKGKSFLALLIAMYVAAGREVFGVDLHRNLIQ